MKYYTDGYTLGRNPSNYGGGYSITDESGDVLRHSRILRDRFTNNDGEIFALKDCVENFCEMFDEVSTDSSTILAWIKKGKSNSRKDLNPILKELKEKIESKFLDIYWEPREENLAGHFNEEFDTGRLISKCL